MPTQMETTYVTVSGHNKPVDLMTTLMVRKINDVNAKVHFKCWFKSRHYKSHRTGCV